MTPKKTLLAAAAVVGLLLLGAAPAHADDAVQDRIDTVIDKFGGEQTAWNEVSWNGGQTVLTVAGGISAFSIGSCDTGKFCAYSSANYLGSRLTFSSCVANQSVAALGGPVRSIANARSTGTVTAYNGNSALFSVFANSGTNTTVTITKLSCS